MMLYHRLGADRIVAETNYGGEMVESVLRQVDRNVSFKAVHASRGKVARAEPIAALYERAQVHHLGVFPELEDELCSFTPAGVPGASPNRADALVWALTELIAQPMNCAGIFEYYRQCYEGVPLSPVKPLLDPDNRLPWRRRYDEMSARETPNHPDAQGGSVEHVNGPLMKPTYAPGSLEWAEQQKENR